MGAQSLWHHRCVEIAVAADGSPVAVYLALPPGRAPGIIHDATVSGGSILELGSGPGRITHPLVELGHEVVAEDDSQAMLDHTQGAETVLADVFTLNLGRTFDAVVAGSHLINKPDALQRRMLLEVCRRHVRDDGVVLIERYDPEWASNPSPSDGQTGPVRVAFRPTELRTGSFSATVTYTLDGQQWSQSFSAASVTDDMLTTESESVGLAFSGWLTDDRLWAILKPA